MLFYVCISYAFYQYEKSVTTEYLEKVLLDRSIIDRSIYWFVKRTQFQLTVTEIIRSFGHYE